MAQLAAEERALFYKLHPVLMFYGNRQLNVLGEEVASPAEYAKLSAEIRLKVRDAIHAQPEVIDGFVRENPFGFPADELDIVASWRQTISGKFYIFRYLKRYTIFLSTESPPKAYGVLGLADPLEVLVGPSLPVLTQAVLLPFRDKIIYDGILSSYRVSFGGGIKRRLNEEYREAKARFGIIASLTGPEQPPPKPTKPHKRKKKPSPRRRLEEVMAMIPCPVAGCWGLHGAETAFYFDEDYECHVLEVWPVGIEEPEGHDGNGDDREEGDILYELAEFDFADLIKEVPLETFHFSQREALFEIGWKEDGIDLLLRVHIEPEEAQEGF